MDRIVKEIRGEKFWLLAEKAIYWEKEDALLIADLHIGKISHFRKSGIALPSKAIQDNLSAFSKLLVKYPSKKVIILGDLFHSDFNHEWIAFSNLLKQFPEVDFILVCGNHDILEKEIFTSSGLQFYDKYLTFSSFVLVHDEQEAPIDDNNYAFCGHLHPGVRLNGLGRQTLSLPCFHINNRRIVLPAFGKFTGYKNLKMEKGDQVFAISEENIFEIN